MKTRFLLLLLANLMSGNVLLSQAKIECFFELSPNYSYRAYKQIESNTDNTLLGDDNRLYKNFTNKYTAEKPDFGFSVSAGINYYFHPKLNLHTSLGYNKLVMEITETDPVDPYYFNSDLSDFSETFHHSMNYLSIPIELQYLPWGRNKFRAGLLLGSNVDIYLGKNYRNDNVSTLEENKYNDATISKITFDIHGGVIFSYQLSESFRFYVSPEFSRAVLPNVKYDIYIPVPITISTERNYSKIHQYNYYGRLRFGVALAI